MAGQMNGRLGHDDRARRQVRGDGQCQWRSGSMTGPFATEPGRHGGGGQILDTVAAASLQVSNARPDAAKLCTTKIQKIIRQRKTKLLLSSFDSLPLSI
jgi:hypothetical protein